MEVKALQQMLSQFRQVQETLEKRIDGLSVEASAGTRSVGSRLYRSRGRASAAGWIVGAKQ